MNRSPDYRTWYFTVWGRRFGFEFSRVYIGECPYLDRYIAYIGGPTLRLHKFWRGDDLRAPHTHPWAFMTIPFCAYRERVFEPYVAWSEDHAQDPPHVVSWNGRDEYDRTVPAWRPSFRRADFQHIVLGRADGKTDPFWTLVITSSIVNREWGFWPDADTFVYWRDWK